MRVAYARRNESQASSPFGSSLATRRSRRPATWEEGTCIRNKQAGRVLAVASISNPTARLEEGGQIVSSTHATDPYTALRDDETPEAPVLSLEHDGVRVATLAD